MSLTRLGYMGAHLQNTTMRNLSITSVPYSRLHLEVASHLYKQGFITSIQKGSVRGPDSEPVEVTPDNIATRRLWLGLKYRGTESVLRKFRLISKPSRRIHMDLDQLKKLAAGKTVREIKPLQPSELVLVKVSNGPFKGTIVELNEAIEQGKGGEVLCRIK